MPTPVVAVILAAGKGTRMRSSLPKVLHQAAGRPLLDWVIAAARAVPCHRIAVVVGHGADEVRLRYQAENLEWILQREQRGTGHALAQAERAVGAVGRLLVLSGDVPLLRPATARRLIDQAGRSGWAMAVAEMAQPGNLGRVLVRPDGALDRIVEAADATEDELLVRTVNAGLYVLPAPAIFDYLRRVRPDNAQRELYLPDALNLAALDGRDVRCIFLDDPSEALGVNTSEELASVDLRLRERATDPGVA